MLPPQDWLDIDRYALAITRRLQARVTADYDRFEFHKAVQALQKALSLSVDGSVGPATWAAIRTEITAYVASIEADAVIRDGELLLYKENVDTLVLPEGVSSIGGYAFGDCTNPIRSALSVPFAFTFTIAVAPAVLVVV